MIYSSPMEIAKEMVRLGFKPENVLNDRMDGWTNTLVDAIENNCGLERKVFLAMQQLAKNRKNERRFVDERYKRVQRVSSEEDIR
jgi:hypothetical protein